MRVSLRDGETFDELLRRFRSGVAKYGIISEFKKHQTFMSKAQKDRVKMRRAVRRHLAKQRRAS